MNQKNRRKALPHITAYLAPPIPTGRCIRGSCGIQYFPTRQRSQMEVIGSTSRHGTWSERGRSRRRFDAAGPANNLAQHAAGTWVGETRSRRDATDDWANGTAPFVTEKAGHKQAPAKNAFRRHGRASRFVTPRGERS